MGKEVAKDKRRRESLWKRAVALKHMEQRRNNALARKDGVLKKQLSAADRKIQEEKSKMRSMRGKEEQRRQQRAARRTKRRSELRQKSKLTKLAEKREEMH